MEFASRSVKPVVPEPPVSCRPLPSEGGELYIELRRQVLVEPCKTVQFLVERVDTFGSVVRRFRKRCDEAAVSRLRRLYERLVLGRRCGLLAMNA